MITRCPHCRTRFGVHADHLALAKGQVQCGRCFNVFDARVEPTSARVAPVVDPPTSEAADKAEFIPLLRPAISAEPPEAEAKTDPEIETTESVPQNASPEPAWATPEELVTESSSEPSWKDFTEDDPEQTGMGVLAQVRNDWPRLLGSVALFGLLLFQVLRAPGVAYVRAHPGTWLTGPVCTLAHCELPPRRDLAAVRLLARDVREHPAYRDTLLINATLENAADFAQPYPLVEIRLANNRNQILGQRAFRPDEYLDTAADLAAGMRPGMPVHLRLEVAIRSDEVSNFEFNFY
jgi:predicted Zn finger-like uncharacterized protein